MEINETTVNNVTNQANDNALVEESNIVYDFGNILNGSEFPEVELDDNDVAIIEAAEETTTEETSSCNDENSQETANDNATTTEENDGSNNRFIDTEAIRAEIAEEYKNDPAYIAGRRLIEDVMRTQGVDIKEASKIVEDSFYASIAQREGISENIARAIFGREGIDSKASNGNINDVNDKAASVLNDISTMQAKGELPEEFSIQSAVSDPDFASLLVQFPTNAAVLLYHEKQMRLQAEKRAATEKQAVAEQIIARGALPKPIKQQQPVVPAVDIASMTDEEFLEAEQSGKFRNLFNN